MTEKFDVKSFGILILFLNLFLGVQVAEAAEKNVALLFNGDDEWLLKESFSSAVNRAGKIFKSKDYKIYKYGVEDDTKTGFLQKIKSLSGTEKLFILLQGHGSHIESEEKFYDMFLKRPDDIKFNSGFPVVDTGEISSLFPDKKKFRHVRFGFNIFGGEDFWIQNMLGLGELSAALSTFKEKNPNAKIIILTEACYGGTVVQYFAETPGVTVFSGTYGSVQAVAARDYEEYWSEVKKLGRIPKSMDEVTTLKSYVHFFLDAVENGRTPSEAHFSASLELTRLHRKNFKIAALMGTEYKLYPIIGYSTFEYKRLIQTQPLATKDAGYMYLQYTADVYDKLLTSLCGEGESEKLKEAFKNVRRELLGRDIERWKKKLSGEENRDRWFREIRAERGSQILSEATLLKTDHEEFNDLADSSADSNALYDVVEDKLAKLYQDGSLSGAETVMRFYDFDKLKFAVNQQFPETKSYSDLSSSVVKKIADYMLGYANPDRSGVPISVYFKENAPSMLSQIYDSIPDDERSFFRLEELLITSEIDPEAPDETQCTTWKNFRDALKGYQQVGGPVQIDASF